MDSGRLSLSGSRPPRWPRTKGAQLFSHPPRPVSREGERDTDRGGRACGEKGSSSGRAGDQILPAAAAAASLLEREEREAAAIDGGGGERRREKKGGGWWWLGSARARRGGGGSRCLAWPGLRCSANPTGFYFIRACLCPSPRAPSMTGGVRTSARGARSQVPRGRPMPDATLSEVGTLPLCGSLSPYPFSKRKKKSPSAEPHARMALWSPKGRKNSLVFQRKPVVYIIRTKRVEFKFGFRSDVYGLACVACDAEKGGVRTTSCESGSPRRAASSISALLNNRRDQISHQPAAVVIGGI